MRLWEQIAPHCTFPGADSAALPAPKAEDPAGPRLRPGEKAATEAQGTAPDTQGKQHRVFTRELCDRNCGLSSPNALAAVMHSPAFVSHRAPSSQRRDAVFQFDLCEELGGTQTAPSYQQHLALSHCRSGARHRARSLLPGLTNRTLAK